MLLRLLALTDATNYQRYLLVDTFTVVEDNLAGVEDVMDSNGPLLVGTAKDLDSTIVRVSVGPSENVTAQDFVDEQLKTISGTVTKDTDGIDEGDTRSRDH